MKTKMILALLLVFYSSSLFAQNPLIGAWEHQADTFKSLKIITPTHWMVIAEDNNKQFMRAHGGTYQLDGTHYIENIEIASWENYGKEKTEFTVSPKGDVFDQSGILVLSDGEMVAINERWHRAGPAISTDNTDKTLGTWRLVSAEEIDAKGKKKAIRENEVFIITPSHWMFIAEDSKSKKFKSAAAGTYTREGNKIIPQVLYASWDKTNPAKIEVTFDVSGDRLTQHGVNLADNTKWRATYTRMDKPKMIKTSAKK